MLTGEINLIADLLVYFYYVLKDKVPNEGGEIKKQQQQITKKTKNTILCLFLKFKVGCLCFYKKFWPL